MTNKELFYLAGKCLSLDEHPGFSSVIIDLNKNGQINWMQFVGLCSNHLVLPTLFLKFRKHNILEHLPEELSEHLSEIYDLNYSRNKQILEQVKQITATLNKDHIYPTFLKGAGNLLDDLYPDIGERMLGDIDFLVPEKDYLNSAKLMKAEGYYEVNPPTEYSDVEYMKHYPRMAHPEHVAVIEIHRIPVNEKLLKEINTTKIDAEKQSVDTLPGCFVLSDKHKIILNFVHSQYGSDENPYNVVSLRDIYDFYLLSKKWPVESALSAIENKQKAKAYFTFAFYALALPENPLQKGKWRLRVFQKKQDLLLASSFFYRFYRTGYFLTQRIFNGYLGQFFSVFYSKKVRKSVIRKLKSRTWYKNHLQLYAKFFRRN